ncbi:3-hydroxyacyl-ACP dehydratase FabZ family protein [Streptomyces spiramyceticus]|uniref:3-hydroxyacyl-ACP dehydratase FabZ family protein n=1 Tax=Streptomyces spiramyceticus TaxID=299717 RepID=UPI00237A3C9E|nr:hotdog domain-containing protein [Streptomyces spiramyceticus]
MSPQGSGAGASALGADGLKLLHSDSAGAVCEFTAESDDPVLIGHYPGFPVQPGVYVIEAADRTARLWAAGAGITDVLELVSMDRCRFHRPVFPGETVSTEVAVVAAEDGDRLTAKAAAVTSGGRVADIRLRYRRRTSRGETQ